MPFFIVQHRSLILNRPNPFSIEPGQKPEIFRSGFPTFSPSGFCLDGLRHKIQPVFSSIGIADHELDGIRCGVFPFCRQFEIEQRRVIDFGIVSSPRSGIGRSEILIYQTLIRRWSQYTLLTETFIIHQGKCVAVFHLIHILTRIVRYTSIIGCYYHQPILGRIIRTCLQSRHDPSYTLIRFGKSGYDFIRRPSGTLAFWNYETGFQSCLLHAIVFYNGQ